MLTPRQKFALNIRNRSRPVPPFFTKKFVARWLARLVLRVFKKYLI
jgi:hypothetical protein